MQAIWIGRGIPVEFSELEREKCREIDLHTHSTASDGTCSPAELVTLAASAGIKVLALTDHDTLSGVAEAQQTGRTLGVEVIPGVELSVDWQGTDIHVLGYGMSRDSTPIQGLLDWVQQQRVCRNEGIAAQMAADGVEVSLPQLRQRWPGAIIGRPHFARLLVEQGRAETVQDAFARWLNPGRPYYLPRVKVTLEQAVQALRESGGVAVLAHPLQYGFSSDKLERLVSEFACTAMGGMEIYYTGYTLPQRQQLVCLAQTYHLFVTGGSDFHGGNKPHIHLGEVEVPRSVVDMLRKRGKER